MRTLYLIILLLTFYQQTSLGQCPITAPSGTTACAGVGIPLTTSCSSPLQYEISTPTTGWVPITGGTNPTYTFVSSAPGVYYIRVVTPSSSTGTPITLTVAQNPPAPVASNYVLCQHAPAQPISAIGSNLKWYTTATGGTGTTVAPVPSTGFPGMTTFWVSQTIGGCEGNRQNVQITVNPAPDTTVSVNGIRLSVLPQSGATYQWLIFNNAFAPIAGATGPAFIPDSSGSYAVAVTKNGCTATSFQHYVCIGHGNLHLDTLAQNPNVATSAFYRSVDFHRYYRVKDTAGQPIGNIPVWFRIYRHGPVGITDSTDVLSTSESSGLLNIYVRVSGSDSLSVNDDLLRDGSYSMVPISFDTGTCSRLINNPPAWLKFTFTIRDYTSSLDDAYGIFYKMKGSLSGCLFCASVGNYGFKGLELGVGLGGGIDLTVHPNNSGTAKWDISTSNNIELSLMTGIKLPLIDVNLISGAVKYGEVIRIKDWEISQSSATDQLFAAWLLLRPALTPLNTNKLLDLLVKGLNAYLHTTPFLITPFDYEVIKTGSAEGAIGLQAEIRDIGSSKKWGLEVSNNISGNIQFAFGTGHFAANSHKMRRTASLLTSFDYTPLNIDFGNHLNLGSGISLNSSAEVSSVRENNNWTEGKVTFTRAEVYNGNMFVANAGEEKEYGLTLSFGNDPLNTVKQDINQGLLNNYIGNYFTGSDLSSLKLLLKASPLSSGNTIQQEAVKLNNYLLAHSNASWAAQQMGWDAVKTYTSVRGFDLSIQDLGLSLGIGGSLSLSANFGRKNSFQYPLEKRVFSNDAGGILPIWRYPDVNSFINPPPNSLPNILWDGLKNAIASKAQDIATAMYDNVSGFVSKVNNVLSSSAYNIVNSYRNTNAAKKMAAGKGAAFIDFSTLQIDIPPGNTAFNSGTNFQYAYYFPGGDLKGIVANTSDTVVFVSDIFYLEAKENGTAITASPNGNFTITASLGKDDLNYLGLDTNGSLNLFYSAYDDTVWQNLGPVNFNSPLVFNTNRLGNYAIGKVLSTDTVPPVIVINMPVRPTSSDVADVLIYDNTSGISWKSVVPALNGKVIGYQHNTFDGHIQIPLSDLDSLGNGTFVFSVQAEDLVGNFSYNVASIALKSDGTIEPHKHLLNVYPNPAQSTLFAVINLQQVKQPTLVLSSIDGTVIQRMNIQSRSGIGKAELDVSNLSVGIYMLSLLDGTHLLETKKIEKR